MVVSCPFGKVTSSGLCRDLQARHQREWYLHYPAWPAQTSTGGISIHRTHKTHRLPPPYSASFRDLHAICGSLKSRLYNIKVFVLAQAKCDMETAGGGWTVIQNRQDGSLDFNRTWQEYREGFGSRQGEHWLGNAVLSALTSTGQQQLRIELEDWHQQRRQATYNNFKVASESQRWSLRHIHIRSVSLGYRLLWIKCEEVLFQEGNKLTHKLIFNTNDNILSFVPYLVQPFQMFSPSPGIVWQRGSTLVMQAMPWATANDTTMMADPSALQTEIMIVMQLVTVVSITVQAGGLTPAWQPTWMDVTTVGATVGWRMVSTGGHGTSLLMAELENGTPSRGWRWR